MAVRSVCSLLLVASLTTAGCGGSNAIHQTELILSGAQHTVVPASAHTKDGKPFTGRTHGTFFEERTMDFVEWAGNFVNGLPEGEFLIYQSCNTEPERVMYKAGVRVTPPNSSSKPTPLRSLFEPTGHFGSVGSLLPRCGAA